ncbi:MAG: hypothetical protein AAGA54_13985 [Myxococcota bacterium]
MSTMARQNGFLRWIRATFVALTLAFVAALAPQSARADVGEPAGWTTSLANHRIVVGRAVLHYEPHLEDDARGLAHVMPQLWSEVEMSLATDLDDTLDIYFLDHAGRVAEATAMPKWVAGVAHSESGEIMIARHGPDGAPTNLEQLLKHEMAHVALHRATGGAKVPRWFHEGVAEAAEGGISLTRSQTLAGMVFGPGVPDFEELEALFYGEGPQVASAYAASRDFVTFLREYRRPDQKGEDVDNLQQLLTEMKLGHTFEASFIRVYRLGLTELGIKWRQGLPGRFVWYPLLAGGTLPFTLVFPLVIVAWFRRRRHYKAGIARLEAEDAALRDRLAADDVAW